MVAIYQLDYSEREVGKNNPKNKKEVGFRFIVDSKEYDVVLTWSFTSGKQSIHVNGVEEYFNRKGVNILDEKFEFDGIQFQMIGTRTRPTKADYSFRCFELLINGTPFLFLSPVGRIIIIEWEESHMGYTNNAESILYLLYPDFSASSSPPGGRVAPQEPPAQMNKEQLPATMEEAPVEAIKTADLLSFDGPAAENNTDDMMAPSAAPAATPYNNYALADDTNNAGNAAAEDLLALSAPPAAGGLLELPMETAPTTASAPTENGGLLSLPAVSSSTTANNPFGAAPPAGDAMVPAAAAPANPWGVTQEQQPPAAATNPWAQQQQTAAPSAGDPWAQAPQQPAAAPPSMWG